MRGKPVSSLWEPNHLEVRPNNRSLHCLARGMPVIRQRQASENEAVSNSLLRRDDAGQTRSPLSLSLSLCLCPPCFLGDRMEKSLSGVKRTVAVPGESSSCGPEREEKAGCNVMELDINEPPADESEEEEEDKEEILMGGADDGEDIGGNGNPRPKRFLPSEEQTRLLEETFRKNCVLTHSIKEEVAAKVKLTPRQVEVWFQNRRARIKLRWAKNECRLLKQHFKLLTEENQRLRKEVKELRALVVVAPTATLAMCPRCKRVPPAACTDHRSKTPDTNLGL